MRWIIAPDRYYWVHLLYVINLLVLTSLVWWALWFQRDTSWTYLSFAFNLLVGPGIMYVLAVLLVPEMPRRIKDWRAYFYRIHRLFYGAMLCLMLAAFAGNLLITGTPLLHPTQGVIVLGLLLSVTGLFSERHYVHAVLVLTMSFLVGFCVVIASNASF